MPTIQHEKAIANIVESKGASTRGMMAAIKKIMNVGRDTIEAEMGWYPRIIPDAYTLVPDPTGHPWPLLHIYEVVDTNMVSEDKLKELGCMADMEIFPRMELSVYYANGSLIEHYDENELCCFSFMSSSEIKQYRVTRSLEGM